jgi:hypothetical protein
MPGPAAPARPRPREARRWRPGGWAGPLPDLPPLATCLACHHLALAGPGAPAGLMTSLNRPHGRDPHFPCGPGITRAAEGAVRAAALLCRPIKIYDAV